MFKFRNKYVAKVSGSGAGHALVPINWRLGPSRVWFKAGVSDAERNEWAALSRKSVVEEHPDGSWTVQDYPPEAPISSLWVGEQRMLEVAARVLRSEWLTMPTQPAQLAQPTQPAQPAQPTQPTQRFYARFDVSGGVVRRMAVWDGSSWREV